jgi:hypothetical protein
MTKRKKTGLEKVMEVLNFYGAKEITNEDLEKDPKLRKAIEEDRKLLLDNTKLSKSVRKRLEKTLVD